MTDITSLVDILTKGGLVTALIIALVGGMRGWYVWKQVHEAAVNALQAALNRTTTEKDEQIGRLLQDRDYWRDQAIRSMTNTGRLTDVIEASRKTLST